MTPGAQVETAIMLLAQIEGQGAPADDVVGRHFRGHRYIGAKDRAAISEHLFAALRSRASLGWWIHRVAPAVVTRDPDRLARARVLAALMLVEGWTAADVEGACDGDRFRPSPLDPQERQMVAGLDGRSQQHPDMPDAVRLNFPGWAEDELRAALGPDFHAEIAALSGTAPLDLRANRLKSSREEAQAMLAAEGIPASPTPLSPLGLRVTRRIPLSTLDAFRSGAVEVQDEGSQLAALLAMARPGMRVVDFCAGAGGKTLALAAEMANRGPLIACDVSARRLERSAERLRRAGVSNVQRRQLENERDKWVKRHKESFDRVFVDAPCTGTGTWRRNPDAKWRLTPRDLEELTALQGSILKSAARLVRPGGRLIYATCSLFPAENDRQVERFLAEGMDSGPAFRLLPIQQVWGEAIGTPCPVATPTLQLTPARHGTDGFFVAVMERLSPEPQSPPTQAEGDPDRSSE